MTPQELTTHYPHVLRFCRKLTGNTHHGEDLAQDTYVKALAALHTYDDRGRPLAWLFTIANRTFLSGLRKHKREVQDVEGYFASRQSIPANQDNVVDLQDALCALRSLTPEHQAVLVPIALGERYTDIAEAQGIDLGTMKSRTVRARRKLVAVTC